MDINQLAMKYIEDQQHDRIPGRYYASELWGIDKGYITPQNFGIKQEYNDISISHIIQGEAKEEKLNQIFTKYFSQEECIWNPKYEIEIDDQITLVVKPDFEFKKFVLECKDSDPEKWEKYWYQAEAEYQATKKPVYFVFFGQKGDKLVREIKLYKHNQTIWKHIIKLLKEFHTKVIENTAKNLSKK